MEKFQTLEQLIERKKTIGDALRKLDGKEKGVSQVSIFHEDSKCEIILYYDEVDVETMIKNIVFQLSHELRKVENRIQTLTA